MRRPWATGGNDVDVALWDAITGEKIDIIKAKHVDKLAWSPSSNRLAIGQGLRGLPEIWDVEKGKKVSSLVGPVRSGDDDCHFQTWSHDGKMLAVEAGYKAKLFDAATGQLVNTMDGSGYGSICFSKDDKTILWVDSEWEVASGKKLRPLQSERLLRLLPPEDKIHGAVNWSADGRFVAGQSQVWDAATGKVVFRLPEGVSDFLSWDFSPDGKTLAMATANGPLRIWDLQSRRAQVASEIGNVFGVKWSPDSKYIRFIREVRTWELKRSGHAVPIWR